MRAEETRRTPVRIGWGVSRVVLAAAFVTTGGAAASCSSSEDQRPDRSDAGSDAASEAASEAGLDGTSVRDAGWADAAPLPIVSAAPPCATSLVTTLGADADDRSQGFCALLSDGTVACWGANGAGQLGRGDDAGTVDSARAARVVGLSDVVMLDHTCAVDKDGGVWCWGTGPFLLDDDAGALTTELTPVKLDLPSATKVARGYATACAAVESGILCWGSNADAQVKPLAATAGAMEPPRLIPIPQGAPVHAMAVGRATFVLREDGTLLTWGANPPLGRLSSIFPDPFPDSVALGGILMADLVHDNACMTAGGIGYCWGAPVFQSFLPQVPRALPEPVVTPEPIVQIATTRTHTIENIGTQRYRWCAAAVSGALYCWGFNESGQAGDGTQDYVLDAVKVEGLPERVAQVKTTPDTTCALLTNGKVYCWGGNYNGQLGNGLNRGRSFVPVEVVFP